MPKALHLKKVLIDNPADFKLTSLTTKSILFSFLKDKIIIRSLEILIPS